MALRPDPSDTDGPTSPTWTKHLPMRAGANVTAPDGTTSSSAERSVESLIAAPRPNHEASLVVLELLVAWLTDSSALLAALNRSP